MSRFRQVRSNINVKRELEDLFWALMFGIVTFLWVISADGPDWAGIGFAVTVFMIRYR